jgi:hypothetical protein
VALSCRRLAGFSQKSGIYWAVSESSNFEKPRDSSQVLSTVYSPSPSKVARPVPSPAAEENPTSAHWPPWSSG